MDVRKGWVNLIYTELELVGAEGMYDMAWRIRDTKPKEGK